METPKELVALNLPSLVANAKQLTVALDIDRELLSEELNPYVTGLATLRLAIGKLDVCDDASNARAVEILNEAAVREKSLTAIWDRYKGPLNKARTVILDMEKKTCGEAETIKKMASAKSGAYIKLREQKKRQAESRISNIVEDQRAALLEQAEDLMFSGDVRGASLKQAEAAMTVAPTLPDLAAAPQNARVTPKFKGECVDLMAVLKAIVEGRVPLVHEVKPGDPRPLVAIDQVVLNAIVSRQGTGTKIPGVHVEEVFNVGAKGGR